MKIRILPISLLVFSTLFLFPKVASAQNNVTVCDADIDQTGFVDIDDYSILVSNFFITPIVVPRANIDKTGLVDIEDYTALAKYFLQVCTTSSSSSSTTTSTQPTRNEWTQDGHDAQRTGYTSESPGSSANWTFVWKWNASDANGGTGGHTYNAPKEARTVTGGSYVYAPAGTSGLYALKKTTGTPDWNIRVTSFNATPAYDTQTGHVFAGGSNGNLYKINPATGNVVGTYNAGNALNKPVMIVGSSVYALTDNGQLHKVDIGTMTREWMYSAGANAGTSMAYSATRQVAIYATSDLYVHAVNSSSGAQKWKTKPTTLPAGFPNEFNTFWPVVAEQNGVVFLRMRLFHDALWSGPGTNGKGGSYPLTNADTRTFLQQNPNLQNLFALDLDDGSKAFIPAVGYGGVEDIVNNAPYINTGPVPVVRKINDQTEVAYSMFRNGQSNTDGRWDSHLGEMVLNNNTIAGLTAGDLRFINHRNGNGVVITDEQTPFTLAGDTIFNAHWGASESTTIVDRSSSKGLTYANPITTTKNPTVIRRQSNCSNKNTATHWTTCGLTLFDDGRFWAGPGWWVYWEVLDPPTPHRSAYSDGLLPRYTYVSDGLIIVEGNGGDLFVLKYR